MNTVTPVLFTTPDGVERTLRATLGSRKRIAEQFGEPNLMEVLKKFGDGALPQVAWCMMFDADGNAPSIKAAALAESISPDDSEHLYACILSAFSQGKASPNEIEELLTALAKLQAEEEAKKQIIGSNSGASLTSASESPTVDNSSTDSSNVSSTPSPELTKSAN